jgi:hypothetical protein
LSTLAHNVLGFIKDLEAMPSTPEQSQANLMVTWFSDSKRLMDGRQLNVLQQRLMHLDKFARYYFDLPKLICYTSGQKDFP